MGLDGALLDVLRFTLAWMFLSTSIDKARHLPAFRKTLGAYPSARPAFVKPVSLTIVALEGLIAAGLLFGIWWRLAAVAAAVLLAIFTLALIARKYLRADAVSPDCGCGGLVPGAASSRVHLITNVAMLAGALLIAVFGDVPGGATAMTLLLGLASLAALLALAAAWAISDLRASRSRLDAAVFGSGA